MAWVRVLLIISNMVALGLFGWILYTNRRPQCIDSRIVEKIDTLTTRGIDSTWACNQRHFIPFNPYFHEILPHLADRLQRVEETFKVIGGLSKPAKIQIIFDRPWHFEVADHSVYIGEQLFMSEGHLERALFKIWYRERKSQVFAYSKLAEEITSDFLLYLVDHEISLEDRYQGYRTKFHGVRWPQVLKSVQAYCESPWKLSEHFNTCIESKNLESSFSDTLMESSLRPLLTAAFVEAYSALSFFEKNEFIRSFSTFVSLQRLPPLNMVGALTEAHPSMILQGREILTEMQEYFSRVGGTKQIQSHKFLALHLAENLRKRGFKDASSEVYFDFIYETKSAVSTDSPSFKELKELSDRRSDIQIAIVDSNNIWFLPSSRSMDIKLFKEIKSRHRMVEICGPFDFGFVMKYSEQVEKLIAIENCGQAFPKNLETYLQDGPQGFARNNKNSFIQFHLPSLVLKRDVIPAATNVVAMVQTRDIKDPVLQALGWQDLRWEKSIEAYHPRAQVEAIQWFRF